MNEILQVFSDLLGIYYQSFAENLLSGILAALIASIVAALWNKRARRRHDRSEDVETAGGSSERYYRRENATFPSILVRFFQFIWRLLQALAVLLGIAGGGISIGVWLGILPPMLGG